MLVSSRKGCLQQFTLFVIVLSVAIVELSMSLLILEEQKWDKSVKQITYILFKWKSMKL